MSEPWRLTATEAVDRLRRARGVALEMVDAAARGSRRSSQGQRPADPFPRRGPGPGQALPTRGQRPSGLAGRAADRGEGLQRCGRAAHHLRLADFANHRAERTTARLPRCVPMAPFRWPSRMCRNLQAAIPSTRYGASPESLGPGAHGRRLFGWRCGRIGRARGLARQRLLPRRLAAHSGELLRHRRASAEPRRRAAGRWPAGIRQPVGRRARWRAPCPTWR